MCQSRLRRSIQYALSLLAVVWFFGSVSAADLTVTAASVANIDAPTDTGTAGGTITAGMAVYLDTATNTLKAASATAAGTYKAKGIALHGSLSGQPLTYAKAGGTINIGATLTVGETYFVSKNGSGAVMPVGDKATTNYLMRIGYATAAGVLVVEMKDYTVQVP